MLTCPPKLKITSFTSSPTPSSFLTCTSGITQHVHIKFAHINEYFHKLGVSQTSPLDLFGLLTTSGTSITSRKAGTEK